MHPDARSPSLGVFLQFAFAALLFLILALLNRIPQAAAPPRGAPAPAPLAAAVVVNAEQPGADNRLRPDRIRVLQPEEFDESLPEGAVARLGTLRFSAENVSAMSFTPDGTTLWTTSLWGVESWDVASGRRTSYGGANLYEESAYERLHGLALCPERPLLACQGKDKQVVVWQLDVDRPLVQCEGAGASTFSTAAFAGDGSLLVAAGDGRVCLWELPSGRLRHSWMLPPKDGWIALATDGARVAAVRQVWRRDDAGDSIYCWDAVTGQQLFRRADPEGAGWNSVAFISGGQMLVTLTDQKLCWWDVPTGVMLRSDKLLDGLPRWSAPLDLRSTRDGKLLATSGLDGVVRLWDTAGGKVIRKFGGQGAAMRLAFAPDEKTLATASFRGAGIRLWNVATGEEIRPRPGHLAMIAGLAFSRDGKQLISTGHDCTIRVWDVAAAKQVRVLEGHEEPATALGLAGQALHSVSPDALCTWDLASGKLVEKQENEDGHASFAFFADGRTVAKSGAGELAIHDWPAGEARKVLADASGAEHNPHVSADGTLIAWANALWSARTGRQLHRLVFQPLPGPKDAAEQGHEKREEKRDALHALAFAPNDRWLATGGADGALRLWEVASGKELFGAAANDCAASALAFSPDGRWLASSKATTLEIRDALTGTVVREFSLRRGGSSAHLAFSPDGKLLASASSDINILLWDVVKATAAYRRAGAELDDVELGDLWEQLGSPDGRAAYAAMARLAGCPKAAAPFLAERLRGVHDHARIAAAAAPVLIRDLSSESLAVRQKAARELSALGRAVETALRDAQAGDVDLETSRRLDVLLDAIDRLAYPPLQLRAIRALTVLELLPSRQRDGALKRVATLEPATWIAREAGAALRRAGVGGE